MSCSPTPCPRCASTKKTTFKSGAYQVDGRDTARCFGSHDGAGPCDFFVEDGVLARQHAPSPFQRMLRLCDTTQQARGLSGPFLADHCNLRSLTPAALDALYPDKGLGIAEAHLKAAAQLLRDYSSSGVAITVAPLYDGFEMVGLELRAPDGEHGPRPGDSHPEGSGKTTRLIGKRGCYLADPFAAPRIAVVIFEGTWNVPAAVFDAFGAGNADFAFIATGGSSTNRDLILRTLDAFYFGVPAVLIPDRDDPGVFQLARKLCARGHRVVAAKLPEQGKDYRDAPRGTRWSSLLDAIERALDSREAQAEAAGASIYRVDHGRIEWMKDTQAGPVPMPLCNFAARITAEVVHDDGERQERVFTLEGSTPRGSRLPPFQVSAMEFASMTWPLRAWGGDANVHAGFGFKDHLRSAILALSEDRERSTIYTSTGWTRTEGGWTFLHAGGGIGTGGQIEGVTTNLAGRLGHYDLGTPIASTSLWEALSSSLRVLDLGPSPVTVALWLAPYRASLETCPFSLHITGTKGGGKSELAAVAAGHFGRDLDAKNPMDSWESTAGAIERQAFLAKDVVGVLDDFRPHGTRQDQAEASKKADRVLRGAFNRHSRGRLAQNARSHREGYCSRGLIISTGEDLPDGESLRSRVLCLDWPAGSMNLKVLTALQAARREGLLAGVMHAFIQWQAEDRDRALEIRRGAHTEATKRLREEGENNRTAEIAADLWSAWPVLMAFIADRGLLSKEEVARLDFLIWASIRATCSAQGAIVSEASPADRFREGLVAVLASGKGHLDHAGTGALPVEWQARCGWASGEPKGNRLGYLSPSHEEVWLIGAATFQEVAKMVGIPGTERALWQRLHELQWLVPEEGKRANRSKARRVLPSGERQDFVVLKIASMWDTAASAPEAGTVGTPGHGTVYTGESPASPAGLPPPLAPVPLGDPVQLDGDGYAWT